MSFFNKAVPHVDFQMRVRDQCVAGDNSYCWESRESESIFGKVRVFLEKVLAETRRCNYRTCQYQRD